MDRAIQRRFTEDSIQPCSRVLTHHQEMINLKMSSKSSILILRSLCLFLLVCMVSSNPPGNPIKCSSPYNTDCTITNSYGEFPDRSICRASKVVYPRTEQELVSIVANASMANRKVKVATRHSHSVPKLVCIDGQDGLLISTKYLNRILKIDKYRMTMKVESGVMLKDVIEHAAKAGLALPYSPYWWGLSMGGMISTGAHGSSLWGKGSAVHEYVERIRIVHPTGRRKGYAKIRTLDNNHPHMAAVKVSLGVLGVISQITLKLQPLFKRSITFLEKNESDFGVQATNFGSQHEFADITWYPSRGKVVYRVDDRISSSVSGNGLSNFIGYRSIPAATLAVARSLEETQELTNDANGKCISTNLTTSTYLSIAHGFSNDGIAFKGYPIIGYQNRLQSSGSCLDSPHDHELTGCIWDPRIKGRVFFHITTITIAMSKVKSFIEDVMKLRDLEPRGFCNLYDGMLMRYVKRSNAYLGKEEDGVDFDMPYYRSHNPMTPRLFEDIIEEIEQLGLFKYGGLPHWGKNRNIAFDGVIKKYGKAREFLKVKQMYDPLGLFSSQWTDQLLGLQGGVTIMKNGCALEGLCICSQDSHCAPKKGYFCRPGRVYKDARVCKRLSRSE